MTASSRRHVRPLGASRCPVPVHLLVKVAMLNHAGELHNAPQLLLSPAASDLRSAQRTHQVRGLLLEAGIGHGEALELVLQLPVHLAVRRLELLDYSAVLVELLGDRLHEL